MKTVATILEAKGSDVWTIVPETTMHEALEAMAEHNVGALVVATPDGVVGIVSERDYARKVELSGARAADVAVSEIMTTDVTSVAPHARAETCLAIMTEQRIRHLPVMTNGDLVGLVSIGDVVKAVIDDLATLVGQLEGYIQGR